MRYTADHDFHIHSTLSPCCHDKNQTPEAILDYARENNLKAICLTNHLWDENVKSPAQWHEEQRFDWITSALPLPQDENIRFLFGAEVDMDYENNIGISRERMEMFDFLIFSTTHLHLSGVTVKVPVSSPEEAARLWVERFWALLKNDLPKNKVGIAHLTCGHILKGQTVDVVKNIDENSMKHLFTASAEKGIGIELNMRAMSIAPEELDILLKPYRIAKECGCKFYLGSDSHKRSALQDAKENFEKIIDLLELTENDKFIVK